MTNTVALPSPTSQPTPRRARTMQTAWAVLLLAFLVFCVMCLASGLGVNYFLFESSVPIGVRLTVGRGTAVLAGTDLVDTAVQSERTIVDSSGYRVRTDIQSQATLSFYDQYANGLLVATLTADINTALTFDEVSRPRFEWTQREYQISLSNVEGTLGITIPENTGRRVQVSLRTPRGEAIYLTNTGDYDILISPQVVRVLNNAGEALIVAGTGVPQPVSTGQRAFYYPPTGQFNRIEGYVDLLGGRPLDDTTVFSSTGSVTQVEEAVWRCSSTANAAPLGNFEFAQVDGREALRYTRGGGATSSGDGICAMALRGGQGVDVTGYNNLFLHAEFKIEGQSLSACGIDASECPFTLRIDYQSVPGGPIQSWYHGFFAYFDPQLRNDFGCDSCTEIHDLVNRSMWYSYTSDNLYALIPSNLRPASIINVRFELSGHEYDVYVDQVRLYAGQFDPPPSSIAS